MNLKEILENAESIYSQIKNSTKLNDKIRVIIGEEPLFKSMDEIYDSDSENNHKIRQLKSNDEEEEIQRRLDEECDNAMSIGFF